MGQIIQLQIGKTGAKIGSQFWKKLLQQHKLSKDGSRKQQNSQKQGKLDIFFRQLKHSQSFYSRAIFADLNSSSMEDIIGSQQASIYQHTNFLYHTCGTRNLYTGGYFSGFDIIDEIMDIIRREAEQCDHLVGFSNISSIAGGTGSGLGTLILQKIQQQFNKQIIMPVCLLPTPNIQSSPIQLYNAVFSLNQINKYTTQPCLLFENQAIFSIKKDKQIQNFSDVNKFISTGLCNLTSPFRFPCDGNISLRKMCNNLIQFPSYKYLVMGMPFENIWGKQKFTNFIRHKMFNYKNYSLKIGKDVQKTQLWISSYFIFRGNEWGSFNVNYKISEQIRKKIFKRYGYNQFKQSYFLKELTHQYIACCVNSQSHAHNNSVTSLHSNTLIRQTCRNLHNEVAKMWRKNAFLHYYKSDGFESDEINQSLESLQDISQLYQYVVSNQQSGCQQQDYSSNTSDCH